MKKYLLTWFLALQGAAFAAAGGSDLGANGLEIAKRSHVASAGFQGDLSEVELTISSSSGDQVQRKFVMKTLEKEGGNRILIEFLSPADVKGAKILTHKKVGGLDSQWLYLPSLRRVKRITGSNKTSLFMGSEFTYEDIADRILQDFAYQWVRKDAVGGESVQVVEATPRYSDSGYSRQVMWFSDAHGLPLRIEYFDRKNELLKVANFSGYAEVSGLTRVGRVDLENVQTRKTSSLVWQERKLKTSFDEHLFDSSAIEGH